MLGQGAMGTVYLAEDPQIERQVAIKIIRADGPGYVPEHRVEVEARFFKEAKIVGRLTHTNIVAIFDIGAQDGLPWIAMEFIDGISLSEKLKKEGTTFPLFEKVRIVRDVAVALAHAHSKGVVHRDIKPGNIMVARDGTVKVADFGIGKVLGESTEMTRTGMMVGSPSYMSPEQIRGEKIDSRSDVFSLGVVFFELVTGARPFPADTITTLVYQILNVEPPDPSTLKADLPPEIGMIIRKALAKSPADRYTCEELGAELTAVLGAFARDGEVPTIVGSMPGFSATSPTRVNPPPASSGRDSASPAPAKKNLWLIPVILALVMLGAATILFVRRERGSSEASGPVSPPAGTVVASGAVTPSPVAPAPPPSPETVVTTAAGAVPPPPPPATPAARPAPAPVRNVPAPPAVNDREEPVPPNRGYTGSADGTFLSRKRFKIDVNPDQARLHLDGQYIGISDDWDGHGGGLYLEPGSGKHHLRVSLAGFHDKNFILEIGEQGSDDEVQVEPKLEKSGSGESFEKKGHPEGSTRGPVILEVSPSSATVAVDGKPVGTAADYSGKPLVLRGGPRVAEILLTPPGGKAKLFRVVVASHGDETIKIKEKF